MRDSMFALRDPRPRTKESDCEVDAEIAHWQLVMALAIHIRSTHHEWDFGIEKGEYSLANTHKKSSAVKPDEGRAWRHVVAADRSLCRMAQIPVSQKRQTRENHCHVSTIWSRTLSSLCV